MFEPEALTEDYDIGLRLKRLGCSQAFVPIAPQGLADFVATREYFPRNFRGALRQRARWTMGICLQAGKSSVGGERRARSIGCGATARACSQIRSASPQISRFSTASSPAFGYEFLLSRSI
ncbi:MAG: glycosyltransferase family 2 protein [Acidobacteriota bacterium]